MNYLYLKIEDAGFSTYTARRRAFAEHLRLVAKALHDIEWVDSCDYGRGDEDAAIDACLASGAVLAQLITDGKKARDELDAEIARAKSVSGEVSK